MAALVAATQARFLNDEEPLGEAGADQGGDSEGAGEKAVTKIEGEVMSISVGEGEAAVDKGTVQINTDFAKVGEGEDAEIALKYEIRQV